MNSEITLYQSQRHGNQYGVWPGEDGGESGGEQVEEEEKEEKREIATGGGHNMEREENYQKEVREWSWWKNHFDEGRYKRSEDNVQAIVWLFAPIRKSLRCLLVIVISLYLGLFQIVFSIYVFCRSTFYRNSSPRSPKWVIQHRYRTNTAQSRATLFCHTIIFWYKILF